MNGERPHLPSAHRPGDTQHGEAHHDAAREVVEDGGSEREHLPSDHRVGQRQADEEGLEGHQRRVPGQAEAQGGGGAEGLGPPAGDGVRERLHHAHRPAVSADGEGHHVK